MADLSAYTPKTPLRLVILAALAWAAPAQSGTFCEGIAEIAEPSPQTSPAALLQGLLFDTELAEAMTPEAAECGTSRIENGLLVCSWSFAYRADEATAAYARATKIARTCLTDNAVATVDQGVSHPDYYEATHFPVAGGDLAVSLKDKAALQTTLVFVRFRAGE
ncbi:MAG: hypothetical protein GY947_00185 [Rhodobacteraceae bacterium]|nr:hypothetical protein [Paracoccaceae bacterium]